MQEYLNSQVLDVYNTDPATLVLFDKNKMSLV